MDKFEKLVFEIIQDAKKDGEPVTREEAEEMAKMELGAKQIKRYEQAEKPRKKRSTPKTVRISNEKKQLFEYLNEVLLKYCENSDKTVEIVKENKLFLIKINEKVFKLDLIEKRMPKI